MRVVILFFAAVSGLTAPAQAQDLPRYDAMATCQKQAATIGQQGNATLVRSCLAQEQWNYDALKAAWPSIPAGARTSCAAQAEMLGGSYLMFAACVVQDQAARTGLDGFTFRY